MTRVAPGIRAAMSRLPRGLMIGSSRPQNTSAGTVIPEIGGIFWAWPAASCRWVDLGSRGLRSWLTSATARAHFSGNGYPGDATALNTSTRWSICCSRVVPGLILRTLAKKPNLMYRSAPRPRTSAGTPPAQIRVRTRSGWQTAMAWASAAPIDTPMMCALAQPTAVMTAIASSSMSRVV